jgi:hypothetical protein
MLDLFFFVSVFLFLVIFVIDGVALLALSEHSDHLLFFKKQIFILQACFLASDPNVITFLIKQFVPKINYSLF